MNHIDFYKWLKKVKPSLELVRYYTHKPDEYRKRMLDDYKEAILIRKQYNILKISLDDNGKDVLEKLINNEQVSFGNKTNPYLFDIYYNWCDILFPFGISEIETLDRKDIAAELKKLRIERGYNREEVAGLIQVHPVSLKEYEDAIRLIPIDKLYSILFVYEVDIDRFLEKIKKSRILYKN